MVVYASLLHRAVVRSLLAVYPVNVRTLTITEVAGFIHVQPQAIDFE